MRWAMLPEKLEAMLEVLEARALLGRPFTRAELDERMEGIQRPAFHAAANIKAADSKRGKVAILPLTGVIAPKSAMVNGESTPSGTGCDAFGAAFDRAMADDSISAIVIDVDSPGGSVDGVPELAAKIFGARGKKPISAIANSMACSAAYFIGSAADEICVTPSGEVGSIGVFMIHEDDSAAYADMGVKHTIIKAGEYKAEGNPFEPLSDDAKAYLQSQVDDFYGMFVGAVARQRGVSNADVRNGFGRGRSVLSKNALKEGMVDRICTLDQLLGKYGVSASSYSAARNASAAAGSGEQLDRAAQLAEMTEIRVPLGSLSHDNIESILQAARSAGPVKLQLLSEGDAAPSTATEIRENQPAPQGQENTVPDTATASPSGAATNAPEAAIAAERKRVQEIRKLCREHNVDDANFADALIDSGASVDTAARSILDLKREQVRSNPQISGMIDRAADRPFASLGDQLVAVMRAGRSDNRALDPRLQRMAAASGMSEGVPADGGFAVQTDFAQEIWRRAYNLGEILSRVRKVPIGANSNGLKMNAIDETSRANGSRYGGIQTFWANEADAGTPKKPKMRQMELNLRKLISLWYVTDELMADSTALASVAQEAFAEEITFVTEDTIFNGTGAGQPFGVLKSAALITQAKEGGQAATTFVTANAAKMFGRLWTRSMTNACWFINQDVYQQLLQLTIGSSAWPVWIPPGGLSAAPYGSLYGRPVVPIEYAQTLGAVGDVLLADFSQYLVIDKGGPLAAESMHVRFVNDEMTYRLTYRVDGQPIWNAALTPKNGSATVSPYIALQAR
jgi:HK97 family phage major capsid protein